MAESTQRSEEEMLAIKQFLHQKLVVSLSFAEVVQIINNMLAKEVDERIVKMSEDELDQLFQELEKNGSE
jgi:predicted HTH domain antitoxin